MRNYAILLVDAEPAYHAILAGLLAPRRGGVDGVTTISAALATVRSGSYDLVLIDPVLMASEGPSAVADIREAARAAAPGGMPAPILAFTGDDAVSAEEAHAGAELDGALPKRFRAVDLITLLSRWLGADRVGRRASPSADGLSALLGASAATAMIERFYRNMDEAIEQIDAGADIPPIGHRLGGLAGTLGFSEHSAAWLALQDGGPAVWPTVRTLALEAIANHRASGSARANTAPGA